MSELRWWERPSIPIAWGVVAMIVYALFPASDFHAVIALSAWGVGVIVWMVVCGVLSMRDRK